MACNELINEGIDSLLHEWQLKFMMIGWSGGFLSQKLDPDQVAQVTAALTEVGSLDYNCICSYR